MTKQKLYRIVLVIAIPLWLGSWAGLGLLLVVGLDGGAMAFPLVFIPMISFFVTFGVSESLPDSPRIQARNKMWAEDNEQHHAAIRALQREHNDKDDEYSRTIRRSFREVADRDRYGGYGSPWEWGED